MFLKLILPIVISFIVRQLEKFGAKTDWALVQADADKRVRDLVPGTWFDDECVEFVNKMFGILRHALGEGDDLKKLLKLIADKKFAEATAVIKDILLAGWAENVANYAVVANYVVV